MIEFFLSAVHYSFPALNCFSFVQNTICNEEKGKEEEEGEREKQRNINHFVIADAIKINDFYGMHVLKNTVAWHKMHNKIAN